MKLKLRLLFKVTFMDFFTFILIGQYKVRQVNNGRGKDHEPEFKLRSP